MPSKFVIGFGYALAWLLHVSPVTLPIPGTTSIEHLTENLQAATLTLSDDQIAHLNTLTDPATV